MIDAYEMLFISFAFHNENKDHLTMKSLTNYNDLNAVIALEHVITV